MLKLNIYIKNKWLISSIMLIINIIQSYKLIVKCLWHNNWSDNSNQTGCKSKFPINEQLNCIMWLYVCLYINSDHVNLFKSQFNLMRKLYFQVNQNQHDKWTWKLNERVTKGISIS